MKSVVIRINTLSLRRAERHDVHHCRSLTHSARSVTNTHAGMEQINPSACLPPRLRAHPIRSGSDNRAVSASPCHAVDGIPSACSITHRATMERRQRWRGHGPRRRQGRSDDALPWRDAQRGRTLPSQRAQATVLASNGFNRPRRCGWHDAQWSGYTDRDQMVC